jgi:dTDP-4-dehydrorhamnose 3,5-epimerase
MLTAATSIPGLVTFTPTPHHDARGFFTRTFDADAAWRAGVDPTAFAQDSLSRSARGVVRGLHLRTGRGEGKLVRCSSGAIFDVVLDLRPDSPARGRWLSFELTGESQRSIYVPAGCAHGFQALTDPADTSYRIDREHDPAEDLTIAWDDPELAIPWPLPVTGLSERDAAAPPLAAVRDLLAGVEARVEARLDARVGPGSR